MTPQELSAALASNNVSVALLAAAIDRPVDDVRAWLDGSAVIPAYMPLTVEAVGKRYPPHNTPPDASVLGIDPARVAFWIKSGSVPRSARLAMAVHARKVAATVTPRDKDILRRIDRGNYYRAAGAWRTLPVMGKPQSALLVKTVRPLIGRGLVRVDDRQHLRLTAAGTREAFK